MAANENVIPCSIHVAIKCSHSHHETSFKGSQPSPVVRYRLNIYALNFFNPLFPLALLTTGFETLSPSGLYHGDCPYVRMCRIASDRCHRTICEAPLT